MIPFLLCSTYRLIVVAEKDVVYKRFPIPLINRLEKHLLVMSSGLRDDQIDLVQELETWVNLFSEAKQEYSSEKTYKEFLNEIYDMLYIYMYVMLTMLGENFHYS